MGFSFVRYRKMNKRIGPHSGRLLPDDGLPLDMAVSQKPSPLPNGSGAPNVTQLIPRGTMAPPYERIRKLDGESQSVPGSPPDV